MKLNREKIICVPNSSACGFLCLNWSDSISESNATLVGASDQDLKSCFREVFECTQADS